MESRPHTQPTDMDHGATADVDRSSSQSSLSESYEAWRNRFAADRLKVLYYLGLVANPVFIGADALLYRPHLQELLLIRAVLETGLVGGFLALRRQLAVFKPQVLLAFWIVFPNICIVHMTLVLGGFTSSYYNGLNLVFLAAAVIVPVSWRSHLTAQVMTLIYYYSANFSFRTDPAAMNAAIENSFFLVWTCVALLFSVYFYERLQHAEYHARVSEGRIRRELEASNRKLLELDRLKSEFFANISHELRTPLTLILGAYRTLLRTASSSETETIIQSGLRNSARLLFLINELLDLSKFDSGRAQLRKRCVDLAALVRSVAANFESSEKHRVHLRGVGEAVPVELDPRQMKKVLYNILSNAFKFSDPAEGQVWIRVIASTEEVELEIEDNGIGIPHEQLDRIFERFTQVEASATRRYEGTGIGLALVKEVITLHGGRIAVDSQPGRGSTFTITLPRGSADTASLVALEEEDGLLGEAVRDSGQDRKGSEQEPTRADAPLLLVADDNADLRGYLGRVLGGQYRVVLAKDGQEALEQARARRPALILTDVMMPRMSGPDLLQAVRSDTALRLTPVLFLTARAGAEAHAESLEAGADDYIAKPFDEHELLARIHNALRIRAQERELAALQRQQVARFLPQHLADLILAGDRDDLLKGHRSEITVVFIDLRGFTAFAEIADPEDVVRVLREYQRDMGRLITQFNGTLERFSGDALMIFFNDPLPVENHAEQAVRMAVAMRDQVDALRHEWLKRGIDLGAGVGIATGYATLGLVGFEERQDYAAIGTVTNLAARLCSEAHHGQILVPARVMELVRALVSTEPLGQLTLKGFRQPVPVFNVASLRQ